jgi:hypothetical protein
MTLKLDNDPVARKHHLKIARDTLRMSDAMVGVMGGMHKPSAERLLAEAEREK